MPTLPEQAAAPSGMFDAFAARMRAEGRAIGDRVFGTRTTTVGAALQLPRKAPLRIEPKTYFGEGAVFGFWIFETLARSCGLRLARSEVEKRN